MKTRKIFYTFFLITIFYLVFAVLSNQKSFSYSTNNTHPVLTEEAGKFFNSRENNKLSQEEIEWLKKGATEEDEPLRYINHFYDPIHNVGWTGKHFGDLSQEEGYAKGAKDAPKPAIASIDWAINQEYQSAYGRQYGNQTWQKALKSYLDGDKKSAFIALGHILHLIEDLSVPDHVRDDTHAGLYGDPGSPYEDYAKTYTNFNKLNISDDLARQNRGLMDFKNLSDAFNYLANYSNKNFFSEDTIINDEFDAPAISNLENEVKIINNDRILFLKNKNTYLAFFSNSKNKYSTDDDLLVLSSYRSELFPQAVLVSASVIDLFFKDVEKYKAQPELLEPIIADSNEPFFQAIWHSPTIIALNLADFFDENWTSAKVFAVETGSSIQTALIGAWNNLTGDNTPAAVVVATKSDFVANPDIGRATSDVTPEIVKHSVSNTTDVRSPTPHIVQNSVFNNIDNSSVSEPPPPSQTPQATTVVVNPPSFTPSLPYPGFGGGSVASSRVIEQEQQNSAEPQSQNQEEQEQEEGTENENEEEAEGEETNEIPPPPPPDIIPPDIIFSILECEDSISPDACLLTGAIELHLSWQSNAGDLDYFELIQNGASATTTATSTVVSVSDNSTNNFSVRAKDTTGNWSDVLTAVVEISSMPIIINEIAWAGSLGHPQDEWIELRNRSSRVVDLKNFVLYSETDGKPYINLSGQIPAKGYYLIERTDDSAISDIAADWFGSFGANEGGGSGLGNGGEILVLNYASTTIDQTALTQRGAWPAGDEYGISMERINADSGGSDANNWTNNDRIIRNGKSAGPEIRDINGTPKARNSVDYLIAGGQPYISSDIVLTKEKSPYFVGNIYTSLVQTFQENATLTIEPGVVVKFYGSAGFNFSGNAKVIARGTADDPIVFTSLYDDEYGGDIHFDAGATLPSYGDWYGVNIYSDGSVFENTIFRYGGKWYNGVGNSMADLNVQNASASIGNSVFENSLVYGLKLSNSNSTVSNNIFRSNNLGADPAGVSAALAIFGGSPAISNNSFFENFHGISVFDTPSAQIDSNVFSSNAGNAISSYGRPPILVNNSGTGNGKNAIVVSGDISQPNSTTTLTVNPLAYVLDGYVQVPAGSALVVESGSVVKGYGGFWGSRLAVFGNFFIQGSNANDVAFTSFSETPNAGDWKGIFAYSGSMTNIKGATFSYADTAISYENSPINLENVKFENNNLAVSADAPSAGQSITALLVEFFNNVVSTSPPDLW